MFSPATEETNRKGDYDFQINERLVWRQKYLHLLSADNKYCLLGSYNALLGLSAKNIVKKSKISFGIQFYSKGRDVTIDFRLVEGHPLIFMAMCHKIYNRVEELQGA